MHRLARTIFSGARHPVHLGDLWLEQGLRTNTIPVSALTSRAEPPVPRQEMTEPMWVASGGTVLLLDVHPDHVSFLEDHWDRYDLGDLVGNPYYADWGVLDQFADYRRLSK